MSDKNQMYRVSCPICRKHIIESSETDSKIKCDCGARFAIWIHDNVICIQELGALEARRAFQESKIKKYSALFQLEN